MTESDGISLSLSRIVESLLEGLEPCFIVYVIERQQSTREELLNLGYQVFTWIAEVQRIVAFECADVYIPATEEYVVNAVFITEYPHGTGSCFPMGTFHVDMTVLTGFLSGKDFLIGDVLPVFTYFLDAVGNTFR